MLLTLKVLINGFIRQFIAPRSTSFHSTYAPWLVTPIKCRFKDLL